MKIPKEDIEAGLPIRWAFYRFMSGYGNGWEFEKWRDYLLRMEEFNPDEDNYDCRAISTLTRIHDEPDFLWDTKKFLKCNNANTLAGFITAYQKWINQYEMLLDGKEECPQ